MSEVRQTIVTFKADDALIDALQGVPNRSAFIRSAILAALDNTCPLCQGSGTLNPHQKKHWLSFRQAHAVAECDECRQPHLICQHEEDEAVHPQ
jgi:hypothetical protein